MNTLAFLGNLAGPDGFLILFFILIFFGAKRLPELARSMGLAVREFNKAKEEFTSQLSSLPAPPAPRQEARSVVTAPVAAVEPATTAAEIPPHA